MRLIGAAASCPRGRQVSFNDRAVPGKGGLLELFGSQLALTPGFTQGKYAEVPQRATFSHASPSLTLSPLHLSPILFLSSFLFSILPPTTFFSACNMSSPQSRPPINCLLMFENPSANCSSLLLFIQKERFVGSSHQKAPTVIQVTFIDSTGYYVCFQSVCSETIVSVNYAVILTPLKG